MDNTKAIHWKAGAKYQIVHPIRSKWITLTLLFAGLLDFSCGARLPATVYSNKGLALLQKIEGSKVSWLTIGQSVEERPILALEKGSGDKTTIIFGGFHGDEMLGVELVLAYAEYLNADENTPSDSKVLIIPALNPDGLVRGTRTNARDVDINRNFPTSNWTDAARASRYFPGKRAASEPETQIAISLIEQYRPDRIISVHIPLEAVNYDGPAKEIAEKMAKHTGYPVKADIGYPTPGSFGTYAGKELGLPVITLELPHGTLDKIWEPNRNALNETIKYK